MNRQIIRAFALIAVASISQALWAQGAINKEALERLVQEAEKAHSTALVIWKDGKLHSEYYFGQKPRKIEAMSATKSVVSLAIGRLITTGKIKSVDQPVHEFYPEWKQGQKKSITLKHLLNHTSGLQNYPNTNVEIYPSPDFVKLTLAAELSSSPETAFSYNNKAVNLLAGIVSIAAGKRMDVYVKEEIFAPLGITDFTWSLDKAGNPVAMAGLQVLPSDLAKIGQLVLNKGKWSDKQIISESWLDIALRPGQELNLTCGLLWWLHYDKVAYVIDDGQLEKIAAEGKTADFISKANSLRGRYETQDDYVVALQKAFGEKWTDIFIPPLSAHITPLAKQVVGKIVGYKALGYLGQYLLIYPEHQLIVVRMIESSSKFDEKTDFLIEIDQLSRKLAN